MSLQKTMLYCLVLLVPTKAMNKSVAVSQNVILQPTQASSFRTSISEQTESLTYQHLVSTRAASRQPSTTGITHIPADREELRLFKDLFNGYDKRLRPVLRKEDNVTVKLGISLNQLIDLDERNQLMKLSLFVRQIWYNPFLRWNKSHYGGISEINVNPSEVWKPDLILYNNADDSTDGSLDRLKTQIKIGSDGMNLWLSPIILRSSCKITVKYFPFDEQHCKLKFGSWTYDGFHLDLIPEAQAGDISKFVRNGEWKLVGAPCKRNEVKYVCCPAPYPDVTYDVQIRRRILFFLFNLVIPCLVIVALTILSFYLPPDSGERISLVITNLLAMTVFMLLVAEIIPPTSDEVSIISTFYSCCIFEVGLALIGTCVVLKYHFSNPSIHKMPGWVRFAVIHCLGRIFKRNNHETKSDKSFEKSAQLQQRSCVRTDNGYIETFVPRNEQLYKRYSAMEKRLSGVTAAKWPADVKSRNIADAAERDPRGAFTERRSSEERDDGDSLTKALTQKQVAIAEALEKLVEAQDAQDDEGKQREEWMMAASILDNMFMWIFLVTLVASVMVLVFQIPKYDD